MKKVKNSYTFLTLGFYFFGSIALLFYIGIAVIFAIILFQENFELSLILIIWGGISEIILLIILGKKMFQWVKVNDKGVKVKCLWGTVLENKWEEIQDVYFERYNISSPGISTAWIVFDDGRKNTVNRNGIVTQKDFIKLKVTKRTLKAVKQFWSKEITFKVNFADYV